MVQTKLSMFIREETTVYGKENTFVTHEYIKQRFSQGTNSHI